MIEGHFQSEDCRANARHDARHMWLEREPIIIIAQIKNSTLQGSNFAGINTADLKKGDLFGPILDIKAMPPIQSKKRLREVRFKIGPRPSVRGATTLRSSSDYLPPAICIFGACLLEGPWL